ncbi:tyrosine-type recombinase/integrase, partial [Patescibacteria group bacterium]
MANTLSNLITEFLEYCEIERGLSQRTVRNYSHYLNRFVDWEKISKAEQITADRVRQYRLKLNRFENTKGEPLKKQTQAYHLIAIRAFLKYLAKRDIKTLAAEKIELPKTSGRQVEFLTGDEVEKLLKQPDAKDMSGLRDRAIFELLFSTGLRISELTNLNIDQVNLKNDSFSVRGKGDKVRVVFLSERARDTLKKYLHERRDDAPALFIR